jgi:hypothetical protein
MNAKLANIKQIKQTTLLQATHDQHAMNNHISPLIVAILG